MLHTTQRHNKDETHDTQRFTIFYLTFLICCYLRILSKNNRISSAPPKKSGLRVIKRIIHKQKKSSRLKKIIKGNLSIIFELSLHHEKGNDPYIAILHAVQHIAFLCVIQ